MTITKDSTGFELECAVRDMHDELSRQGRAGWDEAYQVIEGWFRKARQEAPVAPKKGLGIWAAKRVSCS